jgi:hypothetical protein
MLLKAAFGNHTLRFKNLNSQGSECMLKFEWKKEKTWPAE